MKILYVSGMHAKLEHDQIDVFSSLGHELFSTGHYKDFKNPSAECLYGPLNLQTDHEVLKEFDKLNPNYKIHQLIYLSKPIVDRFDLVIVDNCCPIPNQLETIWQHIKHKPVIYRTYAQQQPIVESTLGALSKQKRITKVRVASTESRIPNFAGTDFIIKGHIDHNLFSGWRGQGSNILTFNNFFDKRTYHSNTALYLRVVNALKNKYPAQLFGQYNEGVPICLGQVSQEEQVELYRNCGVYFSLGSKPAALTYSLQEAMMTGCPVVTFGSKLGNGTPPMYEIPQLFENGIDLFMGDSEEELVFYIDQILKNTALASDLSKNAREKSISLWSKEKIMELWQKAILHSLQ